MCDDLIVNDLISLEQIRNKTKSTRKFIKNQVQANNPEESK